MTRSIAAARRRLRHEIMRRARQHAFYPYLFGGTWRALRTPPVAARADRNFLTALPNPGAGIGHQIANWIAGYRNAALFDCRHAHAPFPDAGWEDLLGFGRGREPIADVRRAGHRPVRLPLFDEDDRQEVARIRRIIAAHADRPTLFLLETDQFVRAQAAARADLADAFATSPARRSIATSYDPAALNIAVHVRRGDVSRALAEASPNIMLRWQEVDYFERVLDRVMAALPVPARARIHIFSQGSADEFASFAHHPHVRLCLDMDARSSFLHLAAADILIASKSGFSYSAALLGHGVRVMPTPFWHDVPDDPLWVEATAEGLFDEAALIAALSITPRSPAAG